MSAESAVSVAQRNALCRAALEARSFSYSPYSKFRVGAALLFANGEIVQGANIENASYGGTICAERTAIVKARTTPSLLLKPAESTSVGVEGQPQIQPILAIAVSTDLNESCSPCGICRQVLREFCKLSVPIYMLTRDWIDTSNGRVANQLSLESTPLGRRRQQGLQVHLQKNDDDIVITAAGRTPFCKAFKGGLRDTPFDVLSLEMFKGILDRADIDPNLIEDVVVGNVRNLDGAYQIRGAAIAAGIPSHVPTMIVNRWCSSGLMAVRAIADQIATGEISIGLAAGVESMTQHPPRQGFSQQLKDAHKDAADAIKPMGWTSEQVAAEWPELVTRKQMDEFAARSHNRATEALCEGRFADEIIPVTARKLERRKNDAGKEQLVENGKEEWATVSQDDGIRHGTTAESLGELKPAFPDWPPSRTTAGNASQVTDGGAAVVLMRRAVANKLGKCILAKYVSTAVSGLEPRIMGIGPALAVPKLLEQTGVAKEEVDLYEINEAFASMGVYCQNQLQIPDDKFNVNGGAIALGHPLGATGTRLVVTILNELARRDQQVGVVSMCIGLGMGAASLLIRERP
ncbi:hypothetical protein CF335_g1965 [Tilletia laevis]|nr:hypothetical protein CF335_g1965 [Tilletia laevis]